MTGRREHRFHPVLVSAPPPQTLQALQHVLLRDEQQEDEEAVERVDKIKDEEEKMVLKIE